MLLKRTTFECYNINFVHALYIIYVMFHRVMEIILEDANVTSSVGDLVILTVIIVINLLLL